MSLLTGEPSTLPEVLACILAAELNSEHPVASGKFFNSMIEDFNNIINIYFFDKQIRQASGCKLLWVCA